jgi:uncharacterized protein YdhG (YjbR/CyaY superfamily)
MENNSKPQTIDEYLSLFTPELRDRLQKLRFFIKEAAPESAEAMIYQMPAFKLKGNLVHFAAYKKHIGFYPGPEAIKVFSDELSHYQLSKGAIRFSLDEELPLDLISRIVKYRVEQNKLKAK